jgi:hypothetical protein
LFDDCNDDGDESARVARGFGEGRERGRRGAREREQRRAERKKKKKIRKKTRQRLVDVEHVELSEDGRRLRFVVFVVVMLLLFSMSDVFRFQ